MDVANAAEVDRFFIKPIRSKLDIASKKQRVTENSRVLESSTSFSSQQCSTDLLPHGGLKNNAVLSADSSSMIYG